MFDEVTKREGGKRAAKRSLWLFGSTAAQFGAIALMIAVSAAVAHQQAEAPMVDVKLVRSSAPPPPPPPPAPPAPARKQPSVAKKPPTNTPPPSMVQPKDMPNELKPPDPTPAEPEDVGEGVEGGVVGSYGGPAAAPAAPAAPPPRPAAPVKFNETMSKPVPISPPRIEYTQAALEREVEGTIVVECTVAVDGSVHGCRVLRSVPFMDSTVVAALQRARYKPATLSDGTPVDCIYEFKIRLELPRE